MEYTINTSQPMQSFNVAGVDRILRNVWNLINTYRYEVAYNRTMGIDPAIFDRPADIAAALYTAEVFKVIANYEPRAAVKSVRLLSTDTEGNMYFEVVVEV